MKTDSSHSLGGFFEHGAFKRAIKWARESQTQKVECVIRSDFEVKSVLKVYHNNNSVTTGVGIGKVRLIVSMSKTQLTVSTGGTLVILGF